MFFKKKSKTAPYFVFNFGCADAKKCVSLSVIDGVAKAEWYDEKGEKHFCDNVLATEDFWAALTAAADEAGIFEWKAFKLFNRFASEINLEVFNGEGFFPDGRTFEANNMHGLPEDFENAVSVLTSVFENF